MRRVAASAAHGRPRSSRWIRQLLACALAAGSAVCTADGVTPSAAPALRMVQSKGTMMWVLDEPATAALAPAATPLLDAQLIEGRYTRVLRAPGPAPASARAGSAGDARIGSGASASRVMPTEQVLPNGARMLALPPDIVAPLAAHPTLIERLIVPGQPGTQAGDLPAANTLYRLPPPR